MAKKRYSTSFIVTSIIYSLFFAIIIFTYNQKTLLPDTLIKPKEELVKFEIIEYTPPPTIPQKPKAIPQKVGVTPQERGQKEKIEPKKQEIQKVVKNTPKPEPKQKKIEKIEKIVKTTPKKIEPTPQKIIPQPKEIVKHEPKPIQKIVQKTELKPTKNTPIVKNQTPKIDHEKIKKEKNTYFSQVKYIIDKNKKYPKVAIRRGIEGIVKIKFTLSHNGDLLSYSITEGSKIFKKSIAEAINESFPLVPPKDLFTSNIDLSLTLDYKLY